jgi:hypothetical protein
MKREWQDLEETIDEARNRHRPTPLADDAMDVVEYGAVSQEEKERFQHFAAALLDLDAIMPAVQAMHNNMLMLGLTPDEVASLRRLQRPLKEALACLRAAVEAHLRAELAHRSAAKLAVVHEAANALQMAIAGTRP